MTGGDMTDPTERTCLPDEPTSTNSAPGIASSDDAVARGLLFPDGDAPTVASAVDAAFEDRADPPGATGDGSVADGNGQAKEATRGSESP
jgi:hypothetical protein